MRGCCAERRIWLCGSEPSKDKFPSVLELLDVRDPPPAIQGRWIARALPSDAVHRRRITSDADILYVTFSQHEKAITATGQSDCNADPHQFWRRELGRSGIDLLLVIELDIHPAICSAWPIVAPTRLHLNWDGATQFIRREDSRTLGRCQQMALRSGRDVPIPRIQDILRFARRAC